jgi:predicted dehydrogenase
MAIDVDARSRRDARALGAGSDHTHLADAAEHCRLDGVVVAGPTRLHARLASEAIDLRVPVFVEKPLTDDVAAARQLVERGGDRLFVMHKWHYHPGIEELAQLAAGDRLGRVHGLTSERFGPANPSEDTDALWLLGPHDITIGACVLGGFPDRLEAVADLAADGLVGVDVIGRWADGRWHRWSMSTRHGPPGRRVIVHGTAGMAVLDDPYQPHVAIHLDGHPEPELVPISTELPLVRELRAFRDHLLGGPPPTTPGADGLAVVETIAAVRVAAGLPESGSHLTAAM